ncbi:hypothetical protein ES703_00007 [subsurface metagenome]
MVEEYVEIRVQKLGEEEWEIKLKGTIPPLDSETVRQLKEAVGDIGDLKIDADGLVVGRVVGNVNQILDRFGRLVKEELVEEVQGKLIKAVKAGEEIFDYGPTTRGVLLAQPPGLPIAPPDGLNFKERAKAIKPYPRIGTAWVHGDYKDRELEFKKKYAVICSVRFGACGYQDAAYGLTIELKGEDGWQSQWSFYSMEDIYELMDRTKASTLRALVGKPMFVHVYGFNSVAGVDVNDALIL